MFAVVFVCLRWQALFYESVIYAAKNPREERFSGYDNPGRPLTSVCDAFFGSFSMNDGFYDQLFYVSNYSRKLVIYRVYCSYFITYRCLIFVPLSQEDVTK